MSDILTRLLLNTGDYDTKLAKAKKSSSDFASNIGGKVAGMVGKFAAGIGVAMGGVEAFSKVISSSQTAGDRYAETMAGLKRGVDEFFTALGTGDFTSFNSGLDGMVARAKEAYRALDQLGNAQMSFDIAQALAQRSIQEGQLAAKNKFAPIDVAKGGFETWRSGINDMTSKVSQLTADTQDYIRKAVESVAGVKGFSAKYLSRLGVFANFMALPSSQLLMPKPSIIHKTTGFFIICTLSYLEAALTITEKSSALREAPPIRPPSTLTFARSSLAQAVVSSGSPKITNPAM